MKLFKISIFPLGLIVLTLAFFYTFHLDFLRTNLSQQHTVDKIHIQAAYDPIDTQAIWWGQKSFSYQLPESETQIANNQILGSVSDKHIEIDLTSQRLYAFENGNKIYDFPISSGLYDWTPRGTFYTWIKLKYTKMSGGNRVLGTYYYLPNVPYVMYFGNDQVPNWRGFGIHGAYWHNDFGRPKSHGCINLKPEDAEKIFYWAPPPTDNKGVVKVTDSNPGIRIVIYGKYQG